MSDLANAAERSAVKLGERNRPAETPAPPLGAATGCPVTSVAANC